MTAPLQTPDALADIRRELIVGFAKLPTNGDVMVWQRQLADAIINAETHSGLDAVELKRHRHLLRVIGDALVHTLLPTHTIRTLTRHPGRAAALAGQGADFEFVFTCAQKLRGHGFIPILADLTTLIGIGDIVGWGREGLVVLECKNRTPPARISTSGRVARQRERGEWAERYLSTSESAEPDTVRAAYELDLPSPHWPAVEQLLLDCLESEIGAASLSLGEDDTLIACAERIAEDDLPRVMPSGASLALPIMANYAELLETSDHRAMSPSSYPISADLRWRLLERKLLLFRCLDMAVLKKTFEQDGVNVRLSPERIDGQFHVRVEVPGYESVSFAPPLVEYCLWMPVPGTAMADVLTDYARQLVLNVTPGEGLGSAMPLADGDHFAYAMAYRDSLDTSATNDNLCS